MNMRSEASLLFYDALSGEFRSPTDPVESPRTLARVTLEAFKYGQKRQAPRDSIVYSPAWADGSVVMAEALRSGDLENVMLDQNIMAGGSNWLSITRVGARALQGNRLSIAGSGGLREMHPLNLETVDYLRDEVAGRAQDFYDRLHEVSELSI